MSEASSEFRVYKKAREGTYCLAEFIYDENKDLIATIEDYFEVECKTPEELKDNFDKAMKAFEKDPINEEDLLGLA